MLLAELSNLVGACALILSAALRCMGQTSDSGAVLLQCLLDQQRGRKTVGQKERFSCQKRSRQEDNPAVPLSCRVFSRTSGRRRSRGSEEGEKTSADIQIYRVAGPPRLEKSAEKRWELCVLKWLEVLESTAQHIRGLVQGRGTSQQGLTPDFVNAVSRLVQIYAG